MREKLVVASENLTASLSLACAQIQPHGIILHRVNVILGDLSEIAGGDCYRIRERNSWFHLVIIDDQLFSRI